jgi:hypothetical protein
MVQGESRLARTSTERRLMINQDRQCPCLVAIGSPYNVENGTDSGQVRVYQIDGQGSSWEWLDQVIYGDSAYDYFGISVNLSPDGNTLAIGSPGYYENNDRLGYVRVFTLEIHDDNVDTGSWK